MLNIFVLAGIIALVTAPLAPYVFADQRGNEGVSPGPVDGVCIYSGSLLTSVFNLTEPLLQDITRDWATIPHPMNHSSTILMDCDDLLDNVGRPGYCRYCKEYAVCSFGRCLKTAGVSEFCCSLAEATEELHVCNEVALPYDPVTSYLIPCEFNYALYEFGSNDAVKPAVILGGLLMILAFN